MPVSNVSSGSQSPSGASGGSAAASSTLQDRSADRRLPQTACWAAVLGLLLIIAGELFFSARQESQTFDESTHLYAGFEYWKHADFGRNPEHPPLAKLIAALPLLPLHLKEPGALPIPYFKALDYVNGTQFLYGADADALLARGRSMIAIFSLALALFVFLAGREMWGDQVGLLALVLLAFEPNFLANGPLITTDVPLTCLFFLSVYLFYRFVLRPSLLRLALCSLSTALAVVTKHSGVLTLAILALLALAELLREQRLTGQKRSSWSSLRSRGAILAGAFVTIALTSYVLLWVFYGFRYAARPGALQITPSLSGYAAGLTNSAESAVILFCARHHLFPEAYLYGWVDILLIPGSRATFLFGKLYAQGRWFFFPAMFLLKSTITLLLLLALAPFAGLWNRSREVVFLAVPAMAFLLLAIASKLNLGVRHILPVYPFFILLAAAAGWAFARRSRWYALALAALLVFAAGSSFHAFPDYLAYSNEIFGGPSNTYRLVTDSNSDWGQELKWTKRYLDQNHITDCWLDYFNPSVNPVYYGIPCKPLPSAWALIAGPAPTLVPPTISGTVLLSGSEVEGLMWGPDGLNPYEQFKHLHPDAQPGNVMMVYRGTFNVPLAAAYGDASTALTMMRMGRMPEAVAAARAAATLSPGSAAMQAVLGQALMASGRIPEGQQAIGNAIHLAQTIHPEYQQRMIRMLTQPPPRK